MLKGFKDFIMRDSVIDLTIDVIIGFVFITVVTAFTGSLLELLLNTIGDAEVKSLGFKIISGNPSTCLDFVAVVTAAISFLPVTAVVYFVIVAPVNKFNEIRKVRLEISTEPGVTEADLLTEIRDLLVGRNGKPGTELN